MNSSVLSTVTDLTYSEFIWWWLHHSDEPDRIASMVGSYYDESSVDGSGPVAAMGGLLLLHGGYTRLTDDWYRALRKHSALPLSPKGQPYVHMKDFGDRGHLRDYSGKGMLFSSLADIINEHKDASIGATVMTEELRYSAAVFRRELNCGLHTLCFVLAAIMQAKIAAKRRYGQQIPYMLDRGCTADTEIDLAHKFITGRVPGFPPANDFKAGGLMWDDDREIPALQAADVIAWTVRRDKSGHPYVGGFESLGEILKFNHHPADAEDDHWTDIFELLR